MNVNTVYAFYLLFLGAPTLMKPSRVFIQQHETPVSKEIDTSGLIDYVDFGPEANSFLLAVGVLHFPSIPVLAELLIERQENYFANLTDKDTVLNQKKLDVYTRCLKRIALASTQTPELRRAPLEKACQRSPCGAKMWNSRGPTGIYFFGIYFLQRIYLFTEDLLGIISCISISAHPHPYPCPPPSPRSSSPSLNSHPQELCGTYFKMYEDLLKKS
jgi:hypothetical protein